jgi:hypothetical protein
MKGAPIMTRLQRAAPALVVAVLFTAAAYEIARNPNLQTLPWTRLGLTRLAWYLAVFLVLSLFRRPILCISAAMLYGMAAIGPGPFAVCILFGIGAVAAGSLVLGDALEGDPCEIPVCLCLGGALLGIAASLAGWTYFCYPLTFLLLTIAPTLAQRRWLAQRAGRIVLPRSSPETWFLLFALGIQFLLVLKPEVGTDSLAMHLALPAYVYNHHHFSYDVREFLWAATPQTVDWCYAVVYSLGGEFAARLLNFVNLLASVGLLYGFAARHCTRRAALLTAALYATGPLVQVVTGSLFIDNLLAGLLLACLIAFWTYRERGNPRLFAAGALLLGLAVSAKDGALPFVPGLLTLCLFAAWRRPPAWRFGFLAAAAGLAIASYYHAVAWWQTGNPFFPYANEIFRSKLFPTERIATQFREPLTWLTFPNIAFHSGMYIEGSDGAAGFHYFLLLPAGLLVLLWRWDRAFVWSAAIGLSAAVLSFSQLSYLRYLYPELLILMAPIAVWLDDLEASRLRRVFASGALGLVALGNILFQSSAGWYHRDFVWNEIWNRPAREAYLRQMAPARVIIEVLNRTAPGEPALFCAFDHIAGFAGPVYTTNWHTYLRHDGVQNLREAIDLLAYVNQRNILHIASPVAEDLDTWPRVLPAFFQDFTEPVFSPGRWVLYRVRPEFAGPGGVERAREWMKDPPPAGPGQWDDIDVRVLRAGAWFRDFSASPALNHTLTRSRSAGDTLNIPFHGPNIALFYARDPDSGIAEVSVDGVSRTTLDQYARISEYRVLYAIEGLADGRHLLTIRVTGTKNPAARDCLVNLDAFVL